MKRHCIYPQVIIQMNLQDMDSIELSEKAEMSYAMLRRKLRGENNLLLSEAKRIKKALGCDMPIDELFATRDEASK